MRPLLDLPKVHINPIIKISYKPIHANLNIIYKILEYSNTRIFMTRSLDIKIIPSHATMKVIDSQYICCTWLDLNFLYTGRKSFGALGAGQYLGCVNG